MKTANAKRHDSRTLLLLLSATAAASVAHYADNIMRFVVYPEPPWLNAGRVDLFWFVMTPFGVAAYLFHKNGRPLAARIATNLYAVMNLFVLGHYLIAPPWKIEPAINLFILLETLGALALLVYRLPRGERAPREQGNANRREFSA